MKKGLLIFGLCWIACMAGAGIVSAQPDLKVKLVLSQTSFKKNNPIGIAFLVYTATDTEVTFNSSQVYDLILKTDEKTIWQWSAGKMFAQSIVFKTITVDDPMLYSIVIDPKQINPRLKPGKYSLTPVLCASPRITGAPVDFEIRIR